MLVAWIKLGRAEEHANIFSIERLKDWVDAGPYVIRKKINTDSSRYSMVIEQIKTQPPL